MPTPMSPTGGIKRSADADDWDKLAAKMRRGARAKRDGQIDDMIMVVMCEEHDVVQWGQHIREQKFELGLGG